MTRTRACPRFARLGGAAAFLAALALAALVPAGPARGWESATAGMEVLERPDGARFAGRVVGGAGSEFPFQFRVSGPAPASGPASVSGTVGAVVAAGTKLPLTVGSIVHRAPRTAAPAPLATPFQVFVGESARLSGPGIELEGDSARLAMPWRSEHWTLPRGALGAVVQRPGESLLLRDDFNALDPARWSSRGAVASADAPARPGHRCLRLPADGAEVAHRLDPPLDAGRIDLGFFDDARVASGRSCRVEAEFRGPSGRSVVRIVLGWAEESLAVEAPSGPTLPVQRLARKSGWRRLSFRFGPGQTEIAVDGDELAHGGGPDGPLVAVRLVTEREDGGSNGGADEGERQKAGPPRSALAAYFDDLRLVRFAEPPSSLLVDVTQDEARLIVGDQIFGAVQSANAAGVQFLAAGRTLSLPWRDVAGLYFRRRPIQGTLLDGLLVRAEWNAGAGDRAADRDFAEGALIAVSDDAITIATPYAGTFPVPRGLLRRLVVLGHGRRLMIDPSAHHLGDEVSVTPPLLDPPQPEGPALDRTFTIEQKDLASADAELVLDVLLVVPEVGDNMYSRQVRMGELRTQATINGQRFDYLNRHVKTKNESPERIRVPVPRGLLRPGKNTLRIETIGAPGARSLYYDDLGILQIALEFPKPPPGDR